MAIATVIEHPQFISPHFSKLVKNLHKRGIHDSIKRNTVRLLQYVDILKRFHGEMMNLHQLHVAVKAFSLSILQNLSKQYPEIKNEVRLIIEERWPHETAAFHSRQKNSLRLYDHY